MHELTISPLPPDQFAGLLGQRAAGFADALRDASTALTGRRMWHINSTGHGTAFPEWSSGEHPCCRRAPYRLTHRW